MKYFSIDEANLNSSGAFDTASEIWNQPAVWVATLEKMLGEKNGFHSFWSEAISNTKKIILTGAGTSAYIGYSLEGSYQRNTKITTVSIPTTHLVTHPMDYLQPDMPVLLISFARSGNSPESIAAVELADKVCQKCYHLIITCDEDGKLARYKSKNPKYTFVLPPESNDKSLAMTSSYTSMLLTGLVLARIDQEEVLKDQVDKLVGFGDKILKDYSEAIKDVAKMDFTRAVFLGSGPLFGTSTESHLKLQELTDGQIICKNDSFLAFRHGPKAVIDEKTVVVFLFSNDESVQRYERDFVASMQKGKEAMMLIGVSDKPIPNLKLDLEIVYSNQGSGIDEEFLAISSVMPAQILGLFKSLELGLKPDNPSVSGAISRVVEGVTIYDAK